MRYFDQSHTGGSSYEKLLSWLLVLALCLSLFPAAALAEGEPEDPAPAEEPADDPDDPVGDAAPDVPSDEETTPPSPTQAPETPPLSGEDNAVPDADPDALPPEGDEPEDVVASGDCGGSLIWT